MLFVRVGGNYESRVRVSLLYVHRVGLLFVVCLVCTLELDLSIIVGTHDDDCTLAHYIINNTVVAQIALVLGYKYTVSLNVSFPKTSVVSGITTTSISKKK